MKNYWCKLCELYHGRLKLIFNRAVSIASLGGLGTVAVVSIIRLFENNNDINWGSVVATAACVLGWLASHWTLEVEDG